jgi:hypothetical protein
MPFTSLASRTRRWSASSSSAVVGDLIECRLEVGELRHCGEDVLLPHTGVHVLGRFRRHHRQGLGVTKYLRHAAALRGENDALLGQQRVPVPEDLAVTFLDGDLAPQAEQVGGRAGRHRLREDRPGPGGDIGLLIRQGGLRDMIGQGGDQRMGAMDELDASRGRVAERQLQRLRDADRLQPFPKP